MRNDIFEQLYGDTKYTVREVKYVINYCEPEVDYCLHAMGLIDSVPEVKLASLSHFLNVAVSETAVLDMNGLFLRLPVRIYAELNGMLFDIWKAKFNDEMINKLTSLPRKSAEKLILELRTSALYEYEPIIDNYFLNNVVKLEDKEVKSGLLQAVDYIENGISKEQLDTLINENELGDDFRTWNKQGIASAVCYQAMGASYMVPAYEISDVLPDKLKGLIANKIKDIDIYDNKFGVKYWIENLVSEYQKMIKEV